MSVLLQYGLANLHTVVAVEGSFYKVAPYWGMDREPRQELPAAVWRQSGNGAGAIWNEEPVRKPFGRVRVLRH